MSNKMIIGILNETTPHEKRVAATPLSIKKLSSQGFKIWIEKNAGLASDFSDSEYIISGAKIKNSTEILHFADILLMLHPSSLKKAKKSSIIIGNFQNHKPNLLIQNTTCFALEKLPRISKTQSFDILSSQDNLSGYQAIIKSASLLKKSIPMMITSAGTNIPVKFLIIGLGVAGLQAIATAKRLGGKVYANDINPKTKEHATSLGAIFIQDIQNILPEVDVIITSAFSNNKKAPLLITKKDLQKIKKNSVLIDMAIAQGGNIEGAINMKTTIINNCQIYANSNLSEQIPQTASLFYANNLNNFLDYLKITPNKIPAFNNKDEIIKSTLIQKG